MHDLLIIYVKNTVMIKLYGFHHVAYYKYHKILLILLALLGKAKKWSKAISIYFTYHPMHNKLGRK